MRLILARAFNYRGVGPAPDNDPPSFNGLVDADVRVGEALTLALSVTDPDGDPITVTVSPLPGASYDAAASEWTFSPGTSQVGSVSVTFTASDQELSDSATITVTVLPAAAGTTPIPVGGGGIAPVGSTAVGVTAAGGPMPRKSGGGGGCSLGSAPAAPAGVAWLTLLGLLVLMRSRREVACSGRRVAVADGFAGLAIVDVTDPPAAKIVHQLDLGNSAKAIAAAGGLAYVGSAFVYYVYDVRDPAQIKSLGQPPTLQPVVFDLALTGSGLLIAAIRGSDGWTVSIYDSSDTADVTRLLTSFEPGSLLVQVGAMAVFFDQPLDPASLTAQTLTLKAAGSDGLLDTPDDVAVTGGSLEFREASLGLFLSLANPLGSGRYKANLAPGVRDRAGNALTAGSAWFFRVFAPDPTDSDGDGIPDEVERTLNLDPTLADSNGNGILDGDEDLDNDGLSNLPKAGGICLSS